MPLLQSVEQYVTPFFGRNGCPSKALLHVAQRKHSSVACQCSPPCVIWPWSTPIWPPQVTQNSANLLSKHSQQYGTLSFITYRWPPNCRSQSKQLKCFICQQRSSASVHSSANITWQTKPTCYYDRLLSYITTVCHGISLYVTTVRHYCMTVSCVRHYDMYVPVCHYSMSL